MEANPWKAQGFVVTETITGELRTRLVHLDEDLDLVDGDGDIHPIPCGAKLLVVEIPYTDDATGQKLLDTAERYFHGLWGHRPHNERTSTAFDIRTAKGGGRADAGDTPF